ncbi:MAG: aldehyde dehydrogenase [Cytophagales bacterium]|nr:aldehyde dehydrogenase [Cytophagales bacterium]
MYKSETVIDLLGKEWGLILNGEERPSADGNYFDLFSPANGEHIARVAAASSADVNQAVSTAKKGFQEWSQLTAYDRLKIINKATEYTRKQADRIGYLMALEQGKPFNQSKGEVISSCDTIDYYAAEGVRIEGYSNPTEKNGLTSWVTYSPVGVCALITPWNYPVSLLSWKLGPALATGCSVVVKPTQVTPLSPTAFCKALIEGGIPAGVIQVLNGGGRSVGEALVNHPDVAKVAMTGSTATGKRLMEVFGPKLKKISLELGGHCPAIVCADADLDNAAKMIAYKGFRNQGQSCSSVNRVYAHSSIKDELIQKLKKIAEGMSIGDGVSDGAVDLGPMCTAGGLQTVLDHVKDAVDKGAVLVTGGKRPEGEAFAKGNYITPVILDKANKSMRVMNEETFGPVVPFDTFDTLDEAIAKANDTHYGLVSYLFTRDLKTMMQVSEKLEAGTVCVTTVRSIPTTPLTKAGKKAATEWNYPVTPCTNT